jgi:molybdopterin-binding protein
VIRLESVCAQLGGFALDGVSLDIPRGGYGLLIGPTGSGKTSLLDVIAGHTAVASGKVFLHDSEVTRVPPEGRAVGVVYQNGRLFPHLNVADNIAYGLFRKGLTPAAQRQRVVELAEALGLTDLLSRGTGNLSGGEAQRVGVARALAPRPDILLLDEPFAALDPSTRRDLRHQLLDLHRREGITTLQVTHDFQEAFQLGHIVAVMDRGSIAQHGSPEEVFQHPNSAFVARFIGAANVLEGTVVREGPAGGPERRFEARFEAEGITLAVVAEEEGPFHAVIHAEDVVLNTTLTTGSSRNHIKATVVSLEHSGPIAFVELDAGHTLRAAITSASAARLELGVGDEVIATIKATAIRLV